MSIYNVKIFQKNMQLQVMMREKLNYGLFLCKKKLNKFLKIKKKLKIKRIFNKKFYHKKNKNTKKIFKKAVMIIQNLNALNKLAKGQFQKLNFFI